MEKSSSKLNRITLDCFEIKIRAIAQCIYAHNILTILKILSKCVSIIHNQNSNRVQCLCIL